MVACPKFSTFTQVAAHFGDKKYPLSGSELRVSCKSYAIALFPPLGLCYCLVCIGFMFQPCMLV